MFWRMHIQFMDDKEAGFDLVGKRYEVCKLANGHIHVYSKDGEMAPEIHMGSFPTENIRFWKLVERR